MTTAQRLEQTAAWSGLEFHCSINSGCYMTCRGISIFAEAGLKDPAQGTQFPPAGWETSATIARLRVGNRSMACGVETLAKRFYVSGAVQGVGFRFFAERTAARLGIAGYARNLFDGRVEVYAIGSAAQLDALKGELRRGPHMAGVAEVAESDAEILPEFSNGFIIERDN